MKELKTTDCYVPSKGATFTCEYLFEGATKKTGVYVLTPEELDEIKDHEFECGRLAEEWETKLRNFVEGKLNK